MTSDKTLGSDPAPQDMYVGAINPYALVEAIIGRTIDENSIDCVRIISDVLQTDYNELFDMKYNSVLYAGMKHNERDNTAEPLKSKEMRLLTEEDLETPNLSNIKKIGDLHEILKDINETRVKEISMHNGNVKLVLQPREELGAKLSNSAVTESICNLVTPFRRQQQIHDWNPPNCSWRDMYEFLHEPSMQKELLLEEGLLKQGRMRELTMFNNPVQGAVGDSWLIAALFAVAWADPYAIVHRTRPTQKGKDHVTQIQLHSKGGRNDASSQNVKVSDEVLVNNSSSFPVYCHSSDAGDLYPALYEMAFAKWITRTSSDHPDITQLAGGDPVKAMAQINNKSPRYYLTHSQSADKLFGLIRTNCMNSTTINPMTAWTHASHRAFRGSNLVGNHAYTILGWATQGGKHYVILRNPWGVTEPSGLNSYPGLLTCIDTIFWSPINKLSQNGVFALEVEAFKDCFAGMGVAK